MLTITICPQSFSPPLCFVFIIWSMVFVGGLFSLSCTLCGCGNGHTCIHTHTGDNCMVGAPFASLFLISSASPDVAHTNVHAYAHWATCLDLVLQVWAATSCFVNSSIQAAPWWEGFGPDPLQRRSQWRAKALLPWSSLNTRASKVWGGSPPWSPETWWVSIQSVSMHVHICVQLGKQKKEKTTRQIEPPGISLGIPLITVLLRLMKKG